VTADTPRIAILGMGRMGHEVEAAARERGVEVVARLDVDEVADREGALAALREADVAIAFTVPGSAVSDIELCLEAGTPMVVGTTGWYDQLDAVVARVEEAEGSLLYAPNFSMGVALMGALLKRAAALLPSMEDFDVHLTETHHAAKVDAPSGTALLLTEALLASGRAVPTTSIRVGHVPGRHEVCIDGKHEQVVVSHEARDRRAFADGALTAALWLRGRKGVYTLDDVLGMEGS
jgi:4-hydroxy-tetrahydrodipicolinate reductase